MQQGRSRPAKGVKMNWQTWLIIGIIGVIIASIVFYQVQKNRINKAFSIWLDKVKRDASDNIEAIRGGTPDSLPHPIPSLEEIIKWLDVAYKKQFEAAKKRADDEGTPFVMIYKDIWSPGRNAGANDIFPYDGTTANKIEALQGNPVFGDVFIRNWVAYWRWQSEINPQHFIDNDGEFKKILISL